MVGSFGFQEPTPLSLQLQDTLLELLILGYKTPESDKRLWEVPEFYNRCLGSYLKGTHQRQQ
jgi:hypothetical protein